MLYKNSYWHTLISYPLNNAIWLFIPLNEYCIIVYGTAVWIRPLNASIFEWTDAVPVRPLWSSDAPLLNIPRMRTEFTRRSFSVAAPHTWTHYHPTLDPAVLWTPSNDISRPIFSDSFNLTPPAPLYLRTLWRYTNAVIIIIIIIMIIVFAAWRVDKLTVHTFTQGCRIAIPK